MVEGWTQHALFNPWSVIQLQPRHHFYKTLVFLRSRNWIDFSSLAAPRLIVSISLGYFLQFVAAAACQRRRSSSSSVLTRSVDFYLLVFVDLAGSDWRDLLFIVLIHSSTRSKDAGPVFPRGRFFHTQTAQTRTHTFVLFHQRALSLSPTQFFPRNFLSFSRARSEPLLLCVNPSCAGSASKRYTSVGCSGAVQVSGLAGASLAVAVAAAAAVRRCVTRVVLCQMDGAIRANKNARAQTHTLGEETRSNLRNGDGRCRLRRALSKSVWLGE